MFINIVFWFGCDRPSGLLLFVPITLLPSILSPLFLPSSPVSLSYFILAVPIRECLRRHSCLSSQFPIAILYDTSSFLSLVQENISMPSGRYYGLISSSGRKNHLIKYTRAGKPILMLYPRHSRKYPIEQSTRSTPLEAVAANQQSYQYQRSWLNNFCSNSTISHIVIYTSFRPAHILTSCFLSE